jgi:tetratricopeptide (TPR) repeat protein
VYYLGQKVDAQPSIADRAITTAEAAVKEAPNDVSARLELASAYIQAGRTDEALGQFEEITTAQPTNRTALLGAGSILFESGDLKGAKAKYEQVVKLSGGQEFSSADPQLEQAYYFLGATNLGLSDVPGAVKSLESALAIDKTDADAWYSLGEAQSRSGDYKKAAASYSQALVFVPSGWCEPYVGLENAFTQLKDNDGVTYSKGMALVCQGKGSEGAAALSSLTTGQFQIPALIGLGLAAESDGESAKAVDYYKQVIAVDPTNITAVSALARLGSPAGGAGSSSTPQPSESAS